MERLDLKNNQQIQFAIALKAAQFRRESLETITNEQVKETLFGFTWSLRQPQTLNEAIDDILKLSISHVVAFLSQQAIIKGAQMSLEDFDDLLN